MTAKHHIDKRRPTSIEIWGARQTDERADAGAILVRQGFQYALRLKAQQTAQLRRWVGCRRFVFNEALAFQHSEVAAGRRRPTFAELCARLLELKRTHPWLAEPPTQALQQALRDLCTAWRLKEGGADDFLDYLGG